MALVDLLPGRPKPIDLDEVYGAIRKPLKAGRAEMMKDAAKRRLCVRFERGDTYYYLNEKGVLNAQSTVTHVNGGGKPRHRIRNQYNMIRPLIEDKVSAATQRIPGFETMPSTTDPEDLTGAKTAEKVALYGYDQWRWRSKSMKVIKSAIGQGGDGFALPYFEPNVGPYTPVGGDWIGQGDVRIITLGGNEVYWEAGVNFDESRWWAVERARAVDEVKNLPGFVKVPLEPDAAASDIPSDRSGQDDLVMVTEVFERPCPRYPDGRRLVVANNRIICDARRIDPQTPYPWEPYPLRDVDNRAIDEPILHRLSYTIDPDSDRDLGLTWQIIDAQRTYQDCVNKLLEWKNRCLNPQMLAAINSLVDRPTDEPGAVKYYRQGFDRPEWERPPNIPQELFQIMETMREAMRFIASYADVQTGPNVASATVQQVMQLNQGRWDSFLGDLAEWHSRLMRHCLLLVARFYTEPRLLQINGRFGPELISDFKGAQINGQVNVRVLPGSIQARTRQDVMNRIQFITQNFPGYLSPQAAIAALDGGTAEKLIESYELDVAKANRIIQKIHDGTWDQMPTRHEIDPATGQPLMDPASQQPMTDPNTGAPLIDPATGGPMLTVGQPAEIPTWMPEDGIDNLDVWQQIISDWCKTPDYERLDKGRQEAAKLILQAIRDLKARQAQREAMQQSMMASSLGMANAASPQAAKPMPSQPKLGT